MVCVIWTKISKVMINSGTNLKFNISGMYANMWNQQLQNIETDKSASGSRTDDIDKSSSSSHARHGHHFQH